MNAFCRLTIGGACLLLTFSTVQAQVPEKLKGSWIIDLEASAKNMEQAPMYKSKEEKIRSRLKFISQIQPVYEFTEKALVSSAKGGMKNVTSLTSTQTGKDKYVFETEGEDGTKGTLVVRVMGEKRINLQFSFTDDMHYYILKPGRPPYKQSAEKDLVDKKE